MKRPPLKDAIIITSGKRVFVQKGYVEGRPSHELYLTPVLSSSGKKWDEKMMTNVAPIFVQNQTVVKKVTSGMAQLLHHSFLGDC